MAGVSRDQLHALRLYPEETVQLACSREKVTELWRQHRSESVPLQYLAGLCWWRSLVLAVGPAVLIPRPETEGMVDLASQLLPGEPHRTGHTQGGGKDPWWADLGTGSGCLAMGLAEAFPRSFGLAADSSAAALDVARRNLSRAGLEERVQLLQGNWFESVLPWWGELHLVLANPPYIPTREVEQLDPVVRDHEPRLALDGGPDGLDAIRVLVRQAPRALAPGGWLLLEHHHDQSEQVLALMQQAGLVDGQAHADFEGRARFVSARRR